MKEKKKTGLIIGAIFSIVSFLLTFTIAIPMYSVMPAIFTENLISQNFPNISYSEVCKINLLIFTVLFIMILFLIKIDTNKASIQKKDNNILKIVLLMLLIYFVIHPIGYYIILWISGFPSDALNAIMSVGSFPFTSLSFVVIGFLVDRIFNQKQSLNKVKK